MWVHGAVSARVGLGVVGAKGWHRTLPKGARTIWSSCSCSANPTNVCMYCSLPNSLTLSFCKQIIFLIVLLPSNDFLISQKFPSFQNSWIFFFLSLVTNHAIDTQCTQTWALCGLNFKPWFAAGDPNPQPFHDSSLIILQLSLNWLREKFTLLADLHCLPLYPHPWVTPQPLACPPTSPGSWVWLARVARVLCGWAMWRDPPHSPLLPPPTPTPLPHPQW